MNNLLPSFIVLEAKKAFLDDVIFPNVTVLPSIYQQMTNTWLVLNKDTIKNIFNGKKNNLNFMDKKKNKLGFTKIFKYRHRLERKLDKDN